ALWLPSAIGPPVGEGIARQIAFVAEEMCRATHVVPATGYIGDPVDGVVYFDARGLGAHRAARDPCLPGPTEVSGLGRRHAKPIGTIRAAIASRCSLSCAEHREIAGIGGPRHEHALRARRTRSRCAATSILVVTDIDRRAARAAHHGAQQ